jgi:membrane protein implicated in regulation of membrane protease activity
VPAVLWLVLALALCAGELLTLDLVLLMLGGAALAGGAAALLVDSAPLQVLAAGLAGLLLLGLVRPAVRRHVEVPGRPSGRARLTGRTALVVQAVTAESGQVRVDGELWRARPWSAGLDVPAGATVVVASVEGATLHVYPSELPPELARPEELP